MSTKPLYTKELFKTCTFRDYTKNNGFKRESEAIHYNLWNCSLKDLPEYSIRLYKDFKKTPVHSANHCGELDRLIYERLKSLDKNASTSELETFHMDVIKNIKLCLKGGSRGEYGQYMVDFMNASLLNTIVNAEFKNSLDFYTLMPENNLKLLYGIGVDKLRSGNSKDRDFDSETYITWLTGFSFNLKNLQINLLTSGDYAALAYESFIVDVLWKFNDKIPGMIDRNVDGVTRETVLDTILVSLDLMDAADSQSNRKVRSIESFLENNYPDAYKRYKTCILCNTDISADSTRAYIMHDLPEVTMTETIEFQ